MASDLSSACSRSSRSTILPKPILFSPLRRSFVVSVARSNKLRSFRIWVSADDNSYLDMWKTAVDRDRKAAQFESIVGKLPDNSGGGEVDLEQKSEEFRKILEIPKDERDRIQRMQVVDRAFAAIAAARSLLNQRKSGNANFDPENEEGGGGELVKEKVSLFFAGTRSSSIFVSRSENAGNGVPGPDFWSWTPPPDDWNDNSDLFDTKKSSRPHTLSNPVAEKDRSMEILSIPFESKFSESIHTPPIPPLQSLMEVVETEVSETINEIHSVKEEEHDLGALSTLHAAEAVHALNKYKTDDLLSQGVKADGSRWWKETGVETRPDGVVCRWTMLRGVSADQEVEWQEKFWEAADDFGYKELGSEKSGRDATGNVWHEYWRESMWQDAGRVHLEKTADKWGKNGRGDEWQEKWWEHYDASGQADKWAHKWCSIDPTTQLEAGHAHVWHERWGEKYDGHGGSIKYTDKWAERCEGDGWTKWGDKWDENFDPNGRGVKQGETWWEGKHRERWNRTWGEGHNCSGWVHKYGKSSSGEHWDTHEPQETWYERFPHYGFYHCFNNSVQLQEVQRPSDTNQL
ncbi:hypothetical protein K2173_013168 [Erythroxylum novogranatense]|uniref:Uncharacterized protein n=1 Tax=Erythroxylum novogranatense TaxID=1862640 RepID=A0AAV8TGL6_9ROSI|nr:hypothetical protein K2173_013168 [Erythroxylum novogranatense]